MSVVLRLAGEEPYECTAVGESYMRGGVEDVVFCFMRFPSGLAAHLHLSWLDPHKERRFTVVGSRKMATFDDMELERKLTVYDKGFDEDFSSYGEYIARSGDVSLARACPTTSRCASSASTSWSACATARTPRSDGESGLRVVRVLEELQPRSTGAAVLRPSDRAPGLLLGEEVAAAAHRADRRQRRDPRRARVIGGEARIQDGAVVGKPLALGPRSHARRDEPARPPRSARAPRSCAGAVIVAGARMGDGAVIGDQAHVRERAVVGEGTRGGPRLGGGQRRDDRRPVCGSRPAATSPPTR